MDLKLLKKGVEALPSFYNNIGDKIKFYNATYTVMTLVCGNAVREAHCFMLIKVQRDANYAVYFILLQNHSTCPATSFQRGQVL